MSSGQLVTWLQPRSHLKFRQFHFQCQLLGFLLSELNPHPFKLQLRMFGLLLMTVSNHGILVLRFTFSLEEIKLPLMWKIIQLHVVAFGLECRCHQLLLLYSFVEFIKLVGKVGFDMHNYILSLQWGTRGLGRPGTSVWPTTLERGGESDEVDEVGGCG